MRKVRLEIDALAVQSFVTATDGAPRGTVPAFDQEGGVYPTPSCQPGETFGGFSCYCLYPRTDPDRICCNSDHWCSNGCGGGGTATCACGTAQNSCDPPCDPV